MGSFVNTLFSLLLGWFQAAVAAVWGIVTRPEENPFWNWFSKRWLLLAAILCIVGLVADWVIYLVRWQPYKVWRSFFRRMRRPAAPREAAYGGPETVAELAPEGPDGRYEADFPPEEAAYSGYRASMAADREPPAPVAPGTVSGGESFPESWPEGASPESAPARRRYRNVRSSYPESAQVSTPENYRFATVMTQTDSEGWSRTQQSEKNLLANRRRIRVSEFFSDQAPGARQAREPKELINASDAYHEPVYPKHWREPEERSE